MPTITEPEYITFNSLVFGTPALTIDDLGPVWTLPGIKGYDLGKEGGDGDTSMQDNFAAIRFQLKVVVFGDADADGVAYSDVRDGIRQNLATVLTAITPNTSSPFTRSLVHTLPDGGSRTAQAKVVGVGPSGRHGAVAIKFGLDFKIPSGSWSYTAP